MHRRLSSIVYCLVNLDRIGVSPYLVQTRSRRRGRISTPSAPSSSATNASAPSGMLPLSPVVGNAAGIGAAAGAAAAGAAAPVGATTYQTLPTPWPLVSRGAVSGVN